jgi:structural maintenance of chromosome 4
VQQLKAETKKQETALEAIHEQMKGTTNRLRMEMESKAQQLAPFLQEKSIFQAALDTAETKVKILVDKTSRMSDRLAKAETELSNVDTVECTKREELQNCEQELNQAQTRIAEAKQEDVVLAGKATQVSAKLKQLLTRIEEAKNVQGSNGAHQRSPAVRDLLHAARKGGPLDKVGVVGRLGDLATIDAQYDVAISTACGGMLDYIVVQSTAGVQRCLDYLRENKIGRANFIPLDKMKKGAHDRQVETPENAPRLFDLITPANFAITPALFLAVQDTLVAPDLETATRWGYDFGKRWRVVTVDGKVIEASGTMSGGGTAVRKGAMRLSSGNKVRFIFTVYSFIEHSLCRRLLLLINRSITTHK